MSAIDTMSELWEANGQQPHETPGPAPHKNVPHGTPEGFDPLSEGASKAIQQVRKNIGYQKPHFMRPLVEMLGQLGQAGLRSSESLQAQEMGRGEFNPYAEQDAAVAQNMQIMQFLAKQEQARKIHELQQQRLVQQAQHNMALKQYYSSSPKGTKKQYAPTNLGKLYQERDMAIEMFGENSPQARTYDLAIQKATTDTDTRKRNLFASNIEKTIEAINPSVLTQYSGPGGAARLKAEQINDLAGQPSEEYLAYKDAIGANELAIGQVRQFLGDSVTESSKKHLEELLNPSSLGSSPEAAKRKLISTWTILGNELGTYRGALSGTEEHKGTTSTADKGKMVEITNKKTGEKRQVTLEEARKLGATNE